MSSPERIGRYRVLGLLGRGAMGVVYRGRDEALDRDVALKVLSLGQGADADTRMRFEREAKAVAKLQHPNIVTIYELGVHEGSPFMAMELLEGVDLQRAIEAGLQPNPRKTLPIVLQLLAGLGHAHEKGIVHRDVKPSNVFLPRGRPAKIMDFGVARLAGGGTTAGMVVGTPNYMSPEQVRTAAVDGRSDLFSAALILYELVTGEKAYKADSVVGLMYKIAHEDPDLSLIPRGPQWERLRRTLARAMARDPDTRYPDARTMASDLALALQDLGGSADWATASDAAVMIRTPRMAAEEQAPTAAGPPAEVARPVAATAAAPPALRNPLLLAAGLVGAAAALLLVALLAPRGSPRAATSSPGAGTTAALSPPPPTTAAPRPTPSVASTPRPPTTTAPAATLAPSVPTPRPEFEVEETPSPEPAPENASLARANELFERGRYAQALAEAKAVLQRDPRNAEAKELAEDAEVEIVVERRIREAKAALERGDKDAALEAARAGLAVKPTDARLIALFREAVQ